MATLARLDVLLGIDTAKLESGLGRAEAAVSKFEKKFKKLGQDLTTYVSLPIAGVATAAATMSARLESEFSKIEGLVGVPREQLQGMTADARDLAVEFGASGQKAGEALFFITSAGLRGADAMETLEAALKASASGLGDAQTVADLTTSAMNAYGSETLSAAQATDVLTAAVREGKLAPDQLAGSMGSVIPIASAMGVEFHEIGAAMAAMSRTGTGAAEASTQIRSILTSLLRPSTEAEAALADIGTSAEELRAVIAEDGLLVGLESIVDAFDGNAAATAAVFGNVRALSGVLDLLGGNAQATRDIFDSMADSTGSLDAAFAAASETTEFKFNQAMSAAGDALIELGNSLKPIIIPALELLTATLRTATKLWASLNPPMQMTIIALGAMVAAAGPVILAISSLSTIIPMVSAALAVLAGPAGIIAGVIVAVGLLASAAWYLRDNWQEVKLSFILLWATIKDAAFSAINGILGMLESLTRHIPFVGDKIAELRTSFNDFADESMAASGRAAAAIERTFMNELQVESLERAAAAATARADAEERAAAAVASSGGGGGGFSVDMSGLSERTVEAVTTSIGKIPETLKPTWEMVAADGASALDAISDKTKGFAEQGIDAIAAWATGSKDAIAQFVASAIKAIARLIAKILIIKALDAVTGGLASALVKTSASISGRARGGPVTGNTPYIVGERGPELFVPGAGGQIVPNGQLAGAGGMSLADIESVLGPKPVPMTPREVAADAWYREFFAYGQGMNERRRGR